MSSSNDKKPPRPLSPAELAAASLLAFGLAALLELAWPGVAAELAKAMRTREAPRGRSRSRTGPPVTFLQRMPKGARPS